MMAFLAAAEDGPDAVPVAVPVAVSGAPAGRYFHQANAPASSSSTIRPAATNGVRRPRVVSALRTSWTAGFAAAGDAAYVPLAAATFPLPLWEAWESGPSRSCSSCSAV